MNHGAVDTTTFKKMNEERSYVLLDVRTPEEFTSGHLKGAENYNFYNEKFINSLDSTNLLD